MTKTIGIAVSDNEAAQYKAMSKEDRKKLTTKAHDAMWGKVEETTKESVKDGSQSTTKTN